LTSERGEIALTEPASGDADDRVTVKRRDFLKVLGGGAAATAVLGCAQEKVEKLIPYLVSPDQTVPGVSTYYATTCRECATGCGVIAETRDGRTIKLEGNPDHPVNQGALCARGQAALQGLYNPDRFRGPMLRNNGALQSTTWAEALRIFAEKVGEVKRGGGAANAVFINQHESGSFGQFLDSWLAGFGMPAHVSYDAEADHAIIAANRQNGGSGWPVLNFKAARLIVSFGADFLDGWGAAVPQQLAFAEARADHKNAPRLVYVGPRRSLTGLNADQWIDCRPGGEIAIARMLSGALTPAQAAQQSGTPEKALVALAREFAATKPAMVLSGTGSSDLSAVVTSLNSVPGDSGAYLGFDGIATAAEMRALSQRMASGGVSLLMVRGANPVYTLPRSVGFGEAMKKVAYKVSFSSVPDETTELADLILPDHHSLEQWGDAEPLRGVLSLQQPAMDPVFDTRATGDVLASVANASASSSWRPGFNDYRSWLISRFPGGSAALASALPKGFLSGSVNYSRPARAIPAVQPGTPIDKSSGSMYLVVYQHPLLGDGRGANKPWLQELPDPVTKICWQTLAEMNPAAMKRLGLANGDYVTVKTSVGTLTLPVLAYPGIQRDTVAIATGRGHPHSGRYASAGYNALDLLPVAEDRSGAFVYASTKADVTKGSGSTWIVTTEGSSRQHGRGIGLAIAVGELDTEGNEAAVTGGNEEPREKGEEMPGDASHQFLPGMRSPVANDAQGDRGDQNSKSKGMYDPNHWSGMAKRRWAMTVDLARCTGCSACVTACYAENNIPTVGADWQGGKFLVDRKGFGANITRSREMAWLRIERYYEGGEDGGADFDTRFVPMMCQHCGNAPCEPVCPVYATYHSPDGLNVQVYNRCVGTRYCSNNCPYKVRYFNWFGYGEPARPQYAFPEPLNWQLNPDVTVRGKGVMEKCTFCVQRIREAENLAKLQDRELKPDEFTTACAASCPSRAITFGDAADENWSVTKVAKDRRAYHVFEELNPFTAVVYLKKVTHPARGA
jgi:anaerobic selenocysteine-containing dehydrogenase/Fe-S-cluster-containing dehydrogenase component